jgi:hypothetical protein
MIAVTGAVLSLAALAAVIYFGLYPRPPVDAPLDPDTLYRGGEAIAHVASFSLGTTANFGDLYDFRVKALKRIEAGDVLHFRRSVCLVLDFGPSLIKDSVACRVIGGS